MIDADFVKEIESLTERAGDQLVTKDVQLADGMTFTYRNNPTEYGRELGDIITPPKPSALLVSTLTGFVDALKAGSFAPDSSLIHVESFLAVSLKARSLDPWGQRAVQITATHTPLNVFSYDSYYTDLQKFIIHLQAAFLQTDALLYLIRLASNLKAGSSVQSQDDGFSQVITLKAGEVSTAEVKVQPRIKLIPRRTFSEASEVESEFLIRFQQSAAGVPTCGLFDLEGKKWQGDLMQSIKRWLAENTTGFSIIA